MLKRYWTLLLASAAILMPPLTAEARQWRATPMAPEIVSSEPL